MTKYTLYQADCREVLSSMPDNSVDAIITDPPYGISMMGKKWDYDVPSADIWAECLRVLKPGGHLLAFASTRTQHRMAVRIEDAGFEIRDMIAWIYGSGFPKSHNLKGDWHGWGTALKPALEPITIARKPLIGTVAKNVLTWGTGAINVDACRIDFVSEADRRESTAKNQHEDFGTPPITNNQVYGDYSMIQPKNYNASSRWPANLIHDGSDEVLDSFPSNVKGGTWDRTSGARHFNNDGKPTDYRTNHSDKSSGSAARFFYCAKANKRDRDEGCENLAAKQSGKEYRSNDDGSHGLQSRLHGATTKGRNYHPTVKPTELMRYLCRLVTPPGGTVLDPFMGSGSTGKAAVLEDFAFIGIEREAEYLDIARARIAAILKEKP